MLKNLFRQKEKKLPVPGTEGTLLFLFLSRMPMDTRTMQIDRYRNIHMNFEFALFVPFEKINKQVENTIQKGFTPWANVDANSAFLYGAGLIDRENFTPIMTWLRSITLPGEKIYAGIHNPGEPMR